MINNEDELLKILNESLEKKEYQKGLDILKDNEGLISKKYYDITKIKIELLMATNNYIEAVLIITEELKVPYIPLDFESFLNDKKKEVYLNLKDKKHVNVTMDDLLKIDTFSNEKLMIYLPYLKDYNLNLLVEPLANLFKRKDITNLNKTLVIASLADFKLDHDFIVLKDNLIIPFNPKDLKDLRETNYYNYLMNKVNKNYETPINVLKIVDRLVLLYLMDVYPLQLSKDSCDELYLASLNLSLKMFDAKTTTSSSPKIIELENKLNKLLETI